MPAKRPAPKPAPTFQRDQRVEDRIIDATVKCFERFGIGKTSMEDIAKLAKLSRPTIYRYFPSRHHLAVEVLVREVRDHTAIVAPLLDETPYPPRALVEGILLAVSTAREHPYTGILVSDAGSELLSRVGGSDRAMLKAMAEMWLPAIQRWRKGGWLRTGINLDDLLLWITLFMHTTLGKGFTALSAERMRRILNTLVVPAVFNLEKLKKDFPREVQA